MEKLLRNILNKILTKLNKTKNLKIGLKVKFGALLTVILQTEIKKTHNCKVKSMFKI